MTQTHTGSCLCGSVKFEMEGEFKKFFLCHCSLCRKTSGSAHCANIFAPGAKLNWLSGKDNMSFYRHAGTNFARNFCATCSSLMPLHAEARDLVIMPAGCLDTDIEITPQAHIFADSKCNWDAVLNDTPIYDQMPT
ncbi:GFA family protein [Colwellia sp. 20A7]|jgi:hypothetical protein|uniref:GFA family protein n=1 Tax=Colwellia sp. 20A7 TaxID=2689569 RepID=UPI00135C5DA3|nr:GFA family protein [Colwellia sp. 20A7]